MINAVASKLYCRSKVTDATGQNAELGEEGQDCRGAGKGQMTSLREVGRRGWVLHRPAGRSRKGKQREETSGRGRGVQTAPGPAGHFKEMKAL